MAALEEYQFEVNGYVFGRDCPIFVGEDGFDPGEPEWVTQDQTNPITGASVMGRDIRTPSDWTWALHVNHDEVDDAMVELGKMGAAWSNFADGWDESREIAMLRYRIGSRTRCVFGRPRRFSAKPDNRLQFGYLPPMASFARSDSLHYDDNEQKLTMKLAPFESGGAIFPLSFPLTFERDTDFTPPSAVVVGGDARTFPTVVFKGPVTNPSVTVGDVTIAMVGTVGDGGSVTIDTRPWRQTVTRVGATAGAVLSRDTRMARSGLRPGAYSAVFRGVDPTGSAQCQILWRDAWHTI